MDCAVARWLKRTNRGQMVQEETQGPNQPAPRTGPEESEAGTLFFDRGYWRLCWWPGSVPAVPTASPVRHRDGILANEWAIFSRLDGRLPRRLPKPAEPRQARHGGRGDHDGSVRKAAFRCRLRSLLRKARPAAGRSLRPPLRLRRAFHNDCGLHLVHRRAVRVFA